MLVGQPNLTEIIQTEPLRALNERITRRIGLMPLTAQEINEYIRHRLDIAGGRGQVEFLPGAVTLIGDLSRGLPRRVNLLCDRALEEGRLAGVTRIDTDMIRRAARAIAGAEPLAPSARRELELPVAVDQPEPPEREMTLTLGQQPARRRGPGLLVGLSLLLAAAALAAGAYTWTIVSSEPGLPSPAAPKLDVGQPPPAIPVPSEEEIKSGLTPGGPPT